MAKVWAKENLNNKPRNKRNRWTVRRTLFTLTWLTQTPTNLNKMQFPLGLFICSFNDLYKAVLKQKQ